MYVYYNGNIKAKLTPSPTSVPISWSNLFLIKLNFIVKNELIGTCETPKQEPQPIYKATINDNKEKVL